MSDEVRVNLMVVEFANANPDNGMKHWVAPCDTLSATDARKQWDVNAYAGAKIVAMCEVVFKDQVFRNIECPYAKTYRALMDLNALFDKPRIQDLLSQIFALGFAAGQDVKVNELQVLGVL
ncbi:MAG: hypothetical protein AAB352_01885 [Patescibacteria group bacterium]